MLDKPRPSVFWDCTQRLENKCPKKLRNCPEKGSLAPRRKPEISHSKSHFLERNAVLTFRYRQTEGLTQKLGLRYHVGIHRSRH
jgi:hypothetical protein